MLIAHREQSPEARDQQETRIRDAHHTHNDRATQLLVGFGLDPEERENRHDIHDRSVVSGP